MSALVPVEADRLARLEATIAAGLNTFVEVGNALAEVREARLYRATHDTFEAYCADRWQISRPRAYELMNAASAVSAMADTGAPLPTNERQARALAPLKDDPAAMAQVMQQAGDKPTAAVLGTLVRERIQPAPPAVSPEFVAAVAGVIEEAREAADELAEHRAWVKAHNERLRRSGFDPALHERQTQVVMRLAAAIDEVLGLPGPAEVASLIPAESAYRLAKAAEAAARLTAIATHLQDAGVTA